MSDQAARGPIFSTTCARCGGSVSGLVSFCPHCGSPARLAFGGRAASGRGLKRGATLMSLAMVMLVGGTLLLRRSDDSHIRELRAKSSTVQGIVRSNDTSPSNPPGRSTPMTADVGPATVASSATPASTAFNVAPQPAQSSFSGSQNGELPSQSSTSSDRGYGDKPHRLMSLALARARDGLNRNDLHTARSGVYWALSLQPDNRDALLLKQDLVSRERARDAALKAARSCAGQERRQCVWESASNALSIDSSSTEAQTLVKRSNIDSAEVRKPSGF